MARPRGEKPERRTQPKKRQLRGEPLRVHLRAAIQEEAATAREAGKAYVYNASALSRATGVSRETLRKHQDFVDGVLTDLAADRRTSDGNATIQMLRQRIARIEAERDEALVKHRALLAHHVQIFKMLHLNSVDVSLLVRSGPKQVSDEVDECPLCGSSFEQKRSKSTRNTVSFEKKWP